MSELGIWRISEKNCTKRRRGIAVVFNSCSLPHLQHVVDFIHYYQIDANSWKQSEELEVNDRRPIEPKTNKIIATQSSNTWISRGITCYSHPTSHTLHLTQLPTYYSHPLLPAAYLATYPTGQQAFRPIFTKTKYARW